jgi:hypothetical protein
VCLAQSPPESSAEPLQLCAVLENSTEHNGKEITVSGQYEESFHGTLLITIGCPRSKVNVRNAAGFKSKKKDLKELKRIVSRGGSAEVVVRGIFKVAGAEQCFGQTCAPYEIEVTELLSVRPRAPTTGDDTIKSRSNSFIHEASHVAAAKE